MYYLIDVYFTILQTLNEILLGLTTLSPTPFTYFYIYFVLNGTQLTTSTLTTPQVLW